MNAPVYYIKKGCLGFGDKILIENLALHLYKGDKIALIGHNGSGKSSIMKVIANLHELIEGEIFIDPSIYVSYLNQESNLPDSSSEVITYLQSHNKSANKYDIESLLDKLHIATNAKINELSGGQTRKILIASALAAKSDILLLDEPTNHLDIKVIEWLEEYIKNYNGTLITISHDRKFLTNISNKVLWLYNKNLYLSNKGFARFNEFQDFIIEQEEKTLIKLNKNLKQENIWLSQGVTARRKRNQGRLKRLRELREKFKNKNSQTSQHSFYQIENDKKAQFIIEASEINFFYGKNKIIDNFSIRIIKGERIALVGPNGAGKTTILKLLYKELNPTSGHVTHGTNLEIAYFDQNKTHISGDKTVLQTLCPQGGDHIEILGKMTHAGAYLKKFMFDPKLLHSKINTLSGGQKTRLSLARILIKPCNLLVLDEPTNDLDIESLDMLLEMLESYNGTIILVSHDRDFIDNFATKTLVLNQKHKVIKINGGYTDYVSQIKETENKKIKKSSHSKQKYNNKPGEKLQLNCKNKLSYKYKRELDLLPQEISNLEDDIKELETILSKDNFYNTNKKDFYNITEALKVKQITLDEKMQRWIELDNLSK